MALAKTKNKWWTQSEVEYLEYNTGLISIDEMANKLNRSKASISCKQIRCNITRYDNFYTFSTLAIDLGTSRETLRRFAVVDGLIKFKRAPFKHGRSNPVMIFEEDVIKFIEKHWHLIDRRTILNATYQKVYDKQYNGESIKTKYFCGNCMYYHYSMSRLHKEHYKYLVDINKVNNKELLNGKSRRWKKLCKCSKE